MSEYHISNKTQILIPPECDYKVVDFKTIY